MQYQIIGLDGHPALTHDDVTALPGATHIEGTHALLFDSQEWPMSEEGGTHDAVRAFCMSLGQGFNFNVMGRSPSARPADETAP